MERLTAGELINLLQRIPPDSILWMDNPLLVYDDKDGWIGYLDFKQFAFVTVSATFHPPES